MKRQATVPGWIRELRVKVRKKWGEGQMEGRVSR
jgi:hypothetical protein